MHHKGTLASKKKKKAKLQRAIRSLKKQQRITSEKSTSNYHTPLNHLRDPQVCLFLLSTSCLSSYVTYQGYLRFHSPQEFAEKLFSRLQNSTKVERFEVNNY